MQTAKHMIVGLGNPGAQYAGTRHNAGELFVNHLAMLAGVRFAKIGQAGEAATIPSLLELIQIAGVRIPAPPRVNKQPRLAPLLVKTAAAAGDAVHSPAGLQPTSPLASPPVTPPVSPPALADVAVVLFKPSSFMNECGGNVASAAKHFAIKPHQMLLAHDCLELNLAEFKLKAGGSAKGHNGVRSIGQRVSLEIPRLRIGIGRPSGGDVGDFVLKKFRSDELARLNDGWGEATTLALLQLLPKAPTAA
ncbi:hypothetical protein CAOG_07992 [Capsaspora owczarzaki ATCC 30864]|uniref:hypothetical protein n=1 Tax=Capsaspora owczarzaki (strain ATCC 30864) TaxID=595528 RepID=UPI0003523DEB|nr:hypothetical protein CAOG_07992 [Capsaspora owczarzaki ATCC 30864]|eukprot:XP_004342593.2 hypothetical protein CAOG_07992 [Capsaspora owczarzaki ATCC 30864]